MTYDPDRETYPCVATYSGVKCTGTTHLQDDLFVCDTCSYSWDTYGFPKGKHHV